MRIDDIPRVFGALVGVILETLSLLLAFFVELVRGGRSDRRDTMVDEAHG